MSIFYNEKKINSNAADKLHKNRYLYDKEIYKSDLKQQMEENLIKFKNQKAVENFQAIQHRDTIIHNSPFGRSGGGAPVYNAHGKLMAGLGAKQNLHYNPFKAASQNSLLKLKHSDNHTNSQPALINKSIKKMPDIISNSLRNSGTQTNFESLVNFIPTQNYSHYSEPSNIIIHHHYGERFNENYMIPRAHTDHNLLNKNLEREIRNDIQINSSSNQNYQAPLNNQQYTTAVLYNKNDSKAEYPIRQHDQSNNNYYYGKGVNDENRMNRFSNDEREKNLDQYFYSSTYDASYNKSNESRSRSSGKKEMQAQNISNYNFELEKILKKKHDELDHFREIQKQIQEKEFNKQYLYQKKIQEQAEERKRMRESEMLADSLTLEKLAVQERSNAPKINETLEGNFIKELEEKRINLAQKEKRLTEVLPNQKISRRKMNFEQYPAELPKNSNNFEEISKNIELAVDVGVERVKNELNVKNNELYQEVLHLKGQALSSEEQKNMAHNEIDTLKERLKNQQILNNVKHNEMASFLNRKSPLEGELNNLELNNSRIPQYFEVQKSSISKNDFKNIEMIKKSSIKEFNDSSRKAIPIIKDNFNSELIKGPVTVYPPNENHPLPSTSIESIDFLDIFSRDKLRAYKGYDELNSPKRFSLNKENS